jgi:aldose 1-epimerase
MTSSEFSRRQAVTSAAATAAALAVSANAAPAHAAGDAHRGGRGPTIGHEPFGSAGGAAVTRYTLRNSAGLTVKILTYGGIVQSVTLPDRHGRDVELVLGFPTVDDYVAHNSPEAGGGVYFGALIGRYANRIALGKFTLDGVTYQIPVNNNGNALHGGTAGFDKKVWSATTALGAGTASLRLEYVSPDGEMGFPGTLTTAATYTLDEENRLTLSFHATTDKPTVVNLTNHSYWNLAGESCGDVYDQVLWLDSDRYTPVDATQIPTGAIDPTAGTPLDFSHPAAIGARVAEADQQLLIGQGYDLNWALRGGGGAKPVLAARARDPHSGRTLTISTTEPGIQFYSGNFLTGTLVGTGGTAYRQSYGFALETQHYPDSPNHPGFPSTVLRPGQVYKQATVFEVTNG